MDDWANNIDRLRETCWDMLETGARDAASPLHRTVLASVGTGGAAEARMLALRGATRADATLEMHTDLASTKVSELRANPLATLLFWHPERMVQIRARVRIAIDEDTAALWSDLSEDARRNYGGTPPTGAPIPRPDAYDKIPDARRMARLVCEVESLDVVYLGPEHRRALYRRSDGFAGEWLAP